VFGREQGRDGVIVEGICADAVDRVGRHDDEATTLDGGERGGEAGDYEDWTVDELKDRAKELGLEGYSDLRKDDLIDLLRRH
jgi:hypothetical protein